MIKYDPVFRLNQSLKFHAKIIIIIEKLYVDFLDKDHGELKEKRIWGCEDVHSGGTEESLSR